MNGSEDLSQDDKP